MDLLSVGKVQSDKDEVRAILYRIVKADTNGDERLPHEDMQSIGLSSPDGKGYKEILAESIGSSAISLWMKRSCCWFFSGKRPAFPQMKR